MRWVGRWVAVGLSLGLGPAYGQPALKVQATVEAPAGCLVEPEEPASVPLAVLQRPATADVPWPTGARTATGVSFAAPGTGPVTVIEDLLEAGEVAREVTLTFGDTRLTVVAPGGRVPRPRDRRHSVVVLPTADLHAYQVAAEVEVRGGQVAYGDIRVETIDGQRAVGHAGITGFLSEPLTCGEQALVRFGPLPAGMPSFKWPKNEGCAGLECARVRRAYVAAVHATWRMTQVMAIVKSYPPESRGWAWQRQGVNAAGQGVGPRTRLAHFFGPYNAERFDTVRELYKDHLNVLRQAKMDGIRLRLKCPDEGPEPGNVCFTSGTWAHAWVKGWVNVCPRLWGTLETTFPHHPELQVSWADYTIAHELYHHHWTWVAGLGWQFVKDKHRHHHGTWCVGSTLEQLVGRPGHPDWDSNLTHLAGYVNADGDQCGHRRVLLQNVDSFNAPAWVFGEHIRAGTLTDWPQPGDPTPQPPNCIDGPNCLCIPTAGNTQPDGDYHPGYFCSGDLECVRTSFGAGNEEGVCTDCNEVNGVGCPCRDGVQPCDVGTCWGDDTKGTNQSWGQCFVDPPDFACLVDCDALLNAGECLALHPDGARCVPYGVGLPAASNCWWLGGHLDPNGEGCVLGPECGPGAPGAVSCADLGYPPYFVCDGLRCVRDL